jgi:hypothetical protein
VRPCLKNIKKGLEGLGMWLKHSSTCFSASKHEALSSNPSAVKEKKKEKSAIKGAIFKSS